MKNSERKERQLAINKAVESVIPYIDDDLDEWRKNYRPTAWKKFRHCQAKTLETENFIILRSYSTIVAAIEKKYGYCYDFLRYVNGYTSTSSQHIAKFFSDFGRHNFRSEERIFTWRKV